MDVRHIHRSAVALLLGCAVLAGCLSCIAPTSVVPASAQRSVASNPAAFLPLVSPMPSASGTCSPSANFSGPVVGSYPTKNIPSLEEQQLRVQQGVGMDMLSPTAAASGYLSDSGVLLGRRVIGYQLTTSRDSATVTFCLADGENFLVELNRAFPNETRSVWAVQRYLHSAP